MTRWPTIRKGSGQDAHSITVGLDAFVNVKPTDEADPRTLYPPESWTSACGRDPPPSTRASILPTITDGFKGKAPDLGRLRIRQHAAALRARNLAGGRRAFRASLRDRPAALKPRHRFCMPVGNESLFGPRIRDCAQDRNRQIVRFPPLAPGSAAKQRRD